MNDLSRYEAAVDLDDPNRSHSQVVELVGNGKRVLDVGCWTGDLGAALTARGCTVTGIERDQSAADKAGQRLAKVLVADLDQTLPSSLVGSDRFDVVVLADVLEHVTDPATLLKDVAGVLDDAGHVVLSLPNVAHGSVRLALLEGRWQYTETGLLDSSHLRFYDRASALALVQSVDLVVTELRGTVADPLAVEVSIDGRRLPPTVVEWVRDQPDALVYQFVIDARPASNGFSGPVPQLVLPRPLDEVRVADEHTERALADIEERHRLLTMRDHIIGLEAAAATAQSAAEIVEKKLRGATKRLNRKNQRIKELSAQVKRLQAQVAAAAAAAPETPSGWRSRLTRGTRQ